VRVRSPDAAQRASDALLIRGPYIAWWVPALRSSVKDAAPRPGHEALVASLHKTGTKDYDRCKIKLSSSSRKLR
jgi:hypothetical protein